MWRRLVGLVLVGCGASAPANPVRIVATTTPDANDAAPLYRPPAAGPRQPHHGECHAFSPPSPPSIPNRRKTYDFAPMVLQPVHAGPVIADRPHAGLGRRSIALRTMFWQNAGEVSQCWRYTSSRGAKPTALEVGVTIDPLGGTRDLSVTSPHAADTELATCVTHAFAGFVFTGVAARPIRLSATLAFEDSGQPPWKQLAPAPKFINHDPRTGTMCTQVIDDGVVPQVRLPYTLVVSNWDGAREPPRPPAVPTVTLGCGTPMWIDADKRAIRTAVRSNYGALRACYADAITREPTLSGELRMQMLLRESGTPMSPKVTSGPGDPQFHACMATALAETWVMPGARDDGGLEINLTFTLEPRPATPPAADDPDALLAAGDPDAAIAAWTAKLAKPVSKVLACRGRAGVLRALYELAPWFDDVRIRTAIADLARAAGDLAPAEANACVHPIEDIILAHVKLGGVTPAGFELTYVALERYTAALPLAPYLDKGPQLRWSHAEALRFTPRTAEADAILAKLRWDPTIGSQVTETLLRRAERVEPISESCRD